MRALHINIDQFGSSEPKRKKPGTLCRKSMTSMLTSDGEEHRKLLLGGIDHGEDTLDVVRRVTVTSSTRHGKGCARRNDGEQDALDFRDAEELSRDTAAEVRDDHGRGVIELWRRVGWTADVTWKRCAHQEEIASRPVRRRTRERTLRPSLC
jgi:hypothetical protein